MNFLIGCCEKQPIRKLGQRLRSYEKENRSLIPAGDKVPILKIRRCSVHLRDSVFPLVKRQAENFHVVVGMTRLIKMPSYWFGDVLAVVFHIQKMFAETISQPSSYFADVKLVTGGAPYAVDDIAGSAVEMIGDLGGVLWVGNRNGVCDERTCVTPLARAFECARFKFCG